MCGNFLRRLALPHFASTFDESRRRLPVPLFGGYHEGILPTNTGGRRRGAALWGWVRRSGAPSAKLGAMGKEAAREATGNDRVKDEGKTDQIEAEVKRDPSINQREGLCARKIGGWDARCGYRHDGRPAVWPSCSYEFQGTRIRPHRCR